MMVMIIMMLPAAQVSAQRINEVLETRNSLTQGARIDALETGTVEFRDVSFKYVASGSGDDVLSHISFHVRPGQFVAIVGGTGTGKSTLVNLIPRFYDVTGGQVLLDGVDVRDYPLEALRGRIGMVLQNNVLFSGTIRENLKWGNPDATEEEVIQAAKDAQAYDFIMSFPDGFDTNLSQGGVNVCLAQALELTDLEQLHQDGVDRSGQPYGIGRVGNVSANNSLSAGEYAAFVKEKLHAAGVRFADGGKPVRRVAVGGGSCGSMLADAAAAGCDTFVTADVKYDQFLEARALGITLMDAGHYATENVVCPKIVQYLSLKFPGIPVKISQTHQEAYGCV